MAVEKRFTRGDHRFSVDSDNTHGVWLSWGVNHATVSAFLPIATAREIAAALTAAADQSRDFALNDDPKAD